jgi:hypothetical protein
MIDVSSAEGPVRAGGKNPFLAEIQFFEHLIFGRKEFASSSQLLQNCKCLYINHISKN